MVSIYNILCAWLSEIDQSDCSVYRMLKNESLN